MENKYNELEKLNELKKDGALTEEEFEIQKSKILNANVKTKKNNRNISKYFFILVAVFVMITIGFVFYHKKCEQEHDDYLSEHMSTDVELKWGSITKSEYEQIEKQKEKNRKTEDTANKMIYISGGITIVLLSAGIIFKVIELKKNKK